MIDCQNESAAPVYEPLTSGIPYRQNNPTPYQPLFQINKQINNIGSNAIYRTPSSPEFAIVAVIFLIIGFGVFIIMLSAAISKNDKREIYQAFLPLIFVLIAFILGSCFSLYITINISANSGLIIINKKKTFFCFNKQEILQISDIQQVIVQTNYYVHYKINRQHFKSFNIIFKLFDGREVTGCYGIIDKNREGSRAFQILRNALPQRIDFDGNLTYKNNF
jgi:hypothetical protein